MTPIIGILAGLIQISGYIYYVQLVKKNKIVPNTTSWLIWSYGNAIVCINYLFLADGISWSESLPIVCAISNVFAGIYFLRKTLKAKKKFDRPQNYEAVILFIDLIITCYWFLTGESEITSILLQVSVFVSFIPITYETWKDPKSEKPGPWIVWSIAYVLFFISELGFNDWIKLIYPAHYLIWHGLIACISIYRAKKLTLV